MLNCTISSDIAPERLELIRKIAAEYTKLTGRRSLEGPEKPCRCFSGFFLHDVRCVMKYKGELKTEFDDFARAISDVLETEMLLSRMRT